MTEQDCLFCRAADRTAPASLVIEQPDVVGFLDIHPVNPGHTLVVPRRHTTGLTGLDPDVGAAMFRAAQRIAAALRQQFGYDAINLMLADGELAGQEVPHVHLHVVPRTSGDPLTVRNEATPVDRAELDRRAAQLRRAVR